MSEIHSGYLSWFLGLTGALIIADALDLTPWIRGIFAGGFLAVEMVGAFVRAKPGDTWSEATWTVLRGRPALYPIAVGWLGWYLWQWVEIFPWEPDPGMLFLAGGVLLWWPAHLIWEGRHG